MIGEGGGGGGVEVGVVGGGGRGGGQNIMAIIKIRDAFLDALYVCMT